MGTAVRGRKRRLPATRTRAFRNAVRKILYCPGNIAKAIPDDWSLDLMTVLRRLQSGNFQYALAVTRNGGEDGRHEIG